MEEGNWRWQEENSETNDEEESHHLHPGDSCPGGGH